MIDPMVQELNEYENREADAAARDERVDQMTEEAIKELDAVDLQGALTGWDVSLVDQVTFKEDSMEHYVHNLMLALRMPATKSMTEMIANSVRNIVFMQMREEIEMGED